MRSEKPGFVIRQRYLLSCPSSYTYHNLDGPFKSTCFEIDNLSSRGQSREYKLRENMLYGVLKIVLLICIFLTKIKGDFKRVCYYSGWAINRPSPNNLDVRHIDAGLCTHLVFAFASLKPNSTQITASSARELAMYLPFTGLKSNNPRLKTMLAVGGWNMGSEPFMYVVRSQDNMNQFANRAVQFLRQYHFDGLDIDWEYPGEKGSPPEDKHRFSQLLSTVRNAFDNEPNRGSKDRLLLSVAVGGGELRANVSYEISEIARHVDFINMMMYDFHGQWEETSLVNHHSSLHSDDNLNVDSLAQFWASHVSQKSQLNVGVPFYGRKFTLVDPSQTGIGASHTGGGDMPYFEICALIQAKNVTEHFLQKERVPYIVDGLLWVGYDNPQSIAEKVTYVKSNHYGGVMVWAIDLDDTTGACGDGQYPLMNAVKNGLLPGAGGIVG